MAVGACRSELPFISQIIGCSDFISFRDSRVTLGASLIHQSGSSTILADLRAERTKASVLASNTPGGVSRVLR